MSYIIRVADNHTLTCTNRQRIMQRSKLVDDLWFLVPPNYNGLDIAKCTVLMEYILPVSRKAKSKILILSEEKYKDHLKYVVPFDTDITSEAGELEVQLSFLYADLDEYGNSVQKSRKTSPAYIKIIPIAAWSDIVPDEMLTALDQRILYQDAQIKALADLSESLNSEKADSLVYEDNMLQLTANGNKIGKPVTIESCDECLEDGVPVVDFTNSTDFVTPDDTTEGSSNDNVVEFDPIKSEITNNENVNNVVEF